MLQSGAPAHGGVVVCGDQGIARMEMEDATATRAWDSMLDRGEGEEEKPAEREEEQKCKEKEDAWMLPAEMWAHILAFVAGHSDLCAARQTCSSWYALLPHPRIAPFDPRLLVDLFLRPRGGCPIGGGTVCVVGGRASGKTSLLRDVVRHLRIAGVSDVFVFTHFPRNWVGCVQSRNIYTRLDAQALQRVAMFFERRVGRVRGGYDPGYDGVDRGEPVLPGLLVFDQMYAPAPGIGYPNPHHLYREARQRGIIAAVIMGDEEQLFAPSDFHLSADAIMAFGSHKNRARRDLLRRIETILYPRMGGSYTLAGETAMTTAVNAVGKETATRIELADAVLARTVGSYRCLVVMQEPRVADDGRTDTMLSVYRADPAQSLSRLSIE